MTIHRPSISADGAGLQNKTIGLVGAGVMGRGIAQLFATKGYDVLLFDLDRTRAGEAVQKAGSMIDREHAKGRASAEEADRSKARLRVANSMDELAGAAMVIEAIVEDLAAKQALFAELEKLVSADCLLATNTSSLLVTSIASAASRQDRIVGLHFFNPVPLMKVVEVIGGAKTAPEALAVAAEVVRSTGHVPVLASDSPGFLVNLTGRGLYTEGLRVVTEGVASVADVDLVMREAAGFPIGPFELLDLTGLDVSFKVMTQIYHQFYEEPRYRPHPMIARQYAAGLYGRKVGQGFYRYDGGMRVEEPQDNPLPNDDRPIWLGPSDCPHADRLRKRFAGLGIALSDSAAPGEEDVILIAPVGFDATSVVVRDGLDAARTIAIDPVFCAGNRLTLMCNPVTRPEYRDSLIGRLRAAGVATTTVRDSPGFIAQRIVATIINGACDIAQQRFASPTDIDLGARLGLGYPNGPLALGDEIGPRVILDIVERMYAFYGDPRYRPSPWLKRRVLLGLSLTTEEA